MAVQESTVINASVDQVVEAFSSEDFARFVCSEVGVEFGSFSVSGDTSAEFTATTERTIPRSGYRPQVRGQRRLHDPGGQRERPRG